MSRSRPRPSPGVAARRAALAAVRRCLAGEYLAPALRSVLDASSLEGPDRSLVTDISYGTIRRLRQIDADLAGLLKSPGKLPPRVLAALRIATYEILHRGTPGYAAVSAWVDIVKRDTPTLAGLANAVLRRVATRAEKAPGDSTGASHGEATADYADRPTSGSGNYDDPADELALPGWLLERFEAALGHDAAKRAALGMLEAEPLWLTAFTPSAIELLEADGCEVSAGPSFAELPIAGAELPIAGAELPIADAEHRQDGGRHADGERRWPRSLAVRAPLPLNHLQAFVQGLVQPQNPASLYAALLLGAKPDERVLDLASGQGVKSAVLAASGAEVVALELLPDRSRAAETNLVRLGQQQRLAVRHLVSDLRSAPTDELLAAVGGPASKVLLDAPCSGTGTLRGNPEIKLRLTPDDVAALKRTQAALLDSAAELVAPGGRLVYAVCALTPEEGPEQIARFLERRPKFEPIAFAPALPHVSSAAGTFILPVDGLDGFYLSLMRRDSTT